MTARMGVAISTTGDEHRLGFLETCVRKWRDALPEGSPLIVTVDGTRDDLFRVGLLLGPTVDVRWVGQPVYESHSFFDSFSTRLGVATNKNTGIEALMDADVVHLFLSDDDTWPLYPQSLIKHTELDAVHSMVNWGRHRLDGQANLWTWPRGVMLYAVRGTINTIGGMVEAFGPGGHEHVEWSQRIHNAGLTPAPFISPASYATRNGMGAAALWHAEDMPRPGEKFGDHRLRRKHLTSVRRTNADWRMIEQIMAQMAGSRAFVPYRAHENGRTSATMCADLMTRAVVPVQPRSEK